MGEEYEICIYNMRGIFFFFRNFADILICSTLSSYPMLSPPCGVVYAVLLFVSLALCNFC